ncbi:MAG: hypothetical protein JWQ04_731, partial [Pedosphaera sp.]|nr:hypothetical protein [Pedosphaera sp.]
VMEGTGAAAGEAYAWAIENPDKVACICAQNPALRSLMTKTSPLDNLSPLAKAGIPLLHICNKFDPRLDEQTRTLEKRYQELSGKITVIINESPQPYSLTTADLNQTVNFVLKNSN